MRGAPRASVWARDIKIRPVADMVVMQACNDGDLCPGGAPGTLGPRKPVDKACVGPDGDCRPCKTDVFFFVLSVSEKSPHIVRQNMFVGLRPQTRGVDEVNKKLS